MPPGDVPTLPDILICGAQRSGTTWLHTLLASHREVFAPARPQEIHFFDDDAEFALGAGRLRSFFSERRDQRLAFATCPLYLYDPRCAGRIADMLPGAKLIFVLRDPVARAYSHYWYEVAQGREKLSFADAITAEPARLADLAQSWRRRPAYIDRGRYATQLARYCQRFPRESIIGLRFDDIVARAEWVAEELAAALGVAPGGWPARMPRRVNGAWRVRSAGLRGLARRMALAGDPVLRRLSSLLARVNRLPFVVPPLDESLAHGIREQLADEVLRTMELTELDLGAWLPTAPAAAEPA